MRLMCIEIIMKNSDFLPNLFYRDRILAKLKCHKNKNYNSINQAISEILKDFYVNINISLAFTPRMYH